MGMVSSTSWTEDEDFSVLLSALVSYEAKVEELGLPDLVVVITGKGPQKNYYVGHIRSLALEHVTFITPWLEVEDYPTMLASADLGVCLHTSSSGLDLPMKVVDMFGCGLPVAAIYFPAIGELVVDGRNGSVFRNSEELSEEVRDWFRKFPGQPSVKHKEFRNELEQFRSLGWKENWDRVALDLFTNKPSVETSFVSQLVTLLFVITIFLVFSSLVPVVG